MCPLEWCLYTIWVFSPLAMSFSPISHYLPMILWNPKTQKSEDILLGQIEVANS